jgi:hypothetical protein
MRGRLVAVPGADSESIALGAGYDPSERSIRVARLAGRQGGVISRGQLRGCGVPPSTIKRWRRAGRLHRLHPAVFAVGHAVVGIRGRLFAALLYAGPAAMLSHQTAAYCWRISPTPPSRVHLSGPNDRRNLTNVRVHRVEDVHPVHRDGLPLTPIPRTLRDLATSLPHPALRRALAEADHLNLLQPDAVRRELGRGRAGSAALRKALDVHLPELADAYSRLEEEFLSICQAAGLSVPEVNVYVEGFKVDCLWREQRVIVELDGAEVHGRPAAVVVDRGRELSLRRAGYVVLRYSWKQVTQAPAAVVADLLAALT